MTITSCGHSLDTSSVRFGLLRPSDEIAHDPDALRQRMAEDGYLYMPGLLDREDVLDARRFVTQKLEEQMQLDPNYPAFDAVANPISTMKFNPELARNNPSLMKVLYTGPMIDFFTRFLGGSIRHFDYTWFRAISPGRGTPPHCDIVYMGRGTKQLYTAWVPVGDVSFEIGGLMILEQSHRHAHKLSRYLESDVDTYCSNLPPDSPTAKRRNGWAKGGALTDNPVTLQKKLGGRWLTAEFRAGDALVFSMQTIHASLDNQSNRFRLSSDSRYQLASEPADERWVGPDVIGHSDAGKRGKIC